MTWQWIPVRTRPIDKKRGATRKPVREKRPDFSELQPLRAGDIIPTIGLKLTLHSDREEDGRGLTGR